MKVFFWRNCKPEKISLFTLIYIAGLSVFACSFAEENDVSLEKIIIQSDKKSAGPLETFVYDKMDAQALSSLPIYSVPETIEYLPFIDARPRGAPGVQSDLSIRGSGFDQVLVMINGCPISDPQTGHYTMDIPITLEDIEHIKMTSQAASHLYGSGAFGGAIDLAVASPEKKSVSILHVGGEHQLEKTSFSASYPAERIKTRLSVEHGSSSGYQQDTDFDVTTVSAVCATDHLTGIFGVSKRHYGAATAYSNLYPHQEDNTDTRFFSLRGVLENEIQRLTSRFFLRRHWSKFLLDRSNPSVFTNYTTNYSLGTGAVYEHLIGQHEITFGFDAGSQWIDSVGLGDHRRNYGALSAGCTIRPIENLTIDAHMRGDYYEKYAWLASPGISLRSDILRIGELILSYQKGFRVPSFTDLYYRSPANLGDEHLSPERSREVELRLESLCGHTKISSSVFRRYGTSLIDWGRNDTSDAWQADNLSDVTTDGADIVASSLVHKEWGFLLCSERSMGYQYLYTEKRSDFLYSKYVLDYLRHAAFLKAAFILPGNLQISCITRYEERIGKGGDFLTDLRLSRKVVHRRWNAEYFLTVTNVFDTAYTGAGDVVMPGRWCEAGLTIEF